MYTFYYAFDGGESAVACRTRVTLRSAHVLVHLSQLGIVILLLSRVGKSPFNFSATKPKQDSVT